MKKFILILFVFSFLFVLVNPIKAETVSCSTFTMTLKMGMNNSEVKCLQEILNANGFQVSSTGAGSLGLETTYFGTKTLAAVKAFQDSNLLVADGIFGPLSRARVFNTNIGSVPSPILGCLSNTGFNPSTGMPCSNTSSLIVSAPVSSAVWVAGSTYTIKWSSNPLMGPLPSTVNITLNAPRPACLDSIPACMVAEMNPYVIATDVTDTGSYVWNIPLNLSTNYHGSMQITVTRNTPSSIGRSGVFSIVTPSLSKFSSPKNSDSWIAGQSYTVSWSSSNLLSLSNIELGLVSVSDVSTTAVTSLDNALSIDSLVVWKYNISNTGSYEFTVPNDLKTGTYRFYLRNINDYAISDDFLITNSLSISPVITGVSGPISLNTGQQGTWTVTAYNSTGGTLSYSVNWADPYFDNISSTLSSEKQTAIFTHTYSREGNYAPLFIITNNTGQTAQASLSVKVTDIATGCVTNTGFNPSTGMPCK